MDNLRLGDKWRSLAKTVGGRVVKQQYGEHEPYLFVKRGLIELTHGDVPKHINNYHLQLPKELCNRHLALVDIENCGFPLSSPIHTISMGMINGEFLIRTYFAMDYSQEKAILRETLSLLKKADLVFTYNGDSFDIARLSKRMAAYGMFEQNGHHDLKGILAGKHIDLYPLVNSYAQRKGKPLLDRKLQTLETVLYETHREDEVQGKDIPGVYERFVEGSRDDFEMGRRIEQMAKVINHNVLDVASMGAVLEDLRRNAQDIVPAVMRGKVVSIPYASDLSRAA